MLNHQLYNDLLLKFRQQYHREPAVVAYAPGRVEVLGNHTDYNEGFVLSAAINFGTFFACAPRAGDTCRLTAGDLMQEVSFRTGALKPSREHGWSNYVKGVLSGLGARQPLTHGFDGMFLGDVPLGSGLSSSAALEMCAGLALEKLYGITVDSLSLARIGQLAEHKYAGVKCGLLDQISSLFGKTGTLVETDFRSLSVKHVPLGRDACLLMCNTHAKHALVDGEYNQRRAACEEATAYFATVLPHPVTALRDVSWQEWETRHAGLPELVARRAAHPTPTVQITALAPGRMARRSVLARNRMGALRKSIIFFASPSATARAAGSVSTRPRSQAALRLIKSASRPRVKLALPAPIRTMFSCVTVFMFTSPDVMQGWRIA